MNKDFWIKRWNDNHIGFNQPVFNKNLIKYFDSMNLKQSDSVFVPLCGKSIDVLFFKEKNYRVLGVEIAEKALSDFFDEQNILCDVNEDGKFTKYSSGLLELYAGDYFDLTKDHMENVGLVYDRASLVAFPEDMRKRYAEHLDRILPVGCKILLLTVVYNQSEMNGPPFSVSREEIETLFGNSFNIRLVETRKVLDENKKFEERGLSSLEEDIYIIKKNK